MNWKRQREYKYKTSDFKKWEQKAYVKAWLVSPENTIERLSTDEVCLSKEELIVYQRYL